MRRLDSCGGEVVARDFLYYIPFGGKNFGDELAPRIAERLNPRCKCKNLKPYLKKFYLHRNNYTQLKNTMSGLGSIMHLLPQNCNVWGTGVHPRFTRTDIAFKNLNLFAVRGPRTYDFFNKHYNVSSEIIFGDPALLFPRLFSEHMNPVEIQYETTLILHHSDYGYEHDLKIKNLKVVRCSEKLDNVIDIIKKSNRIISSSLHGIILGEMLNKKTIWLELPNSKKTQTDFKYYDYYESTNRYNLVPARSLESALEITVDKPTFDDSKLYESFFECYNSEAK